MSDQDARVIALEQALEQAHLAHERLAKALREEQLRNALLMAQVGGWEGACAAQIEVIEDMVVFIERGEGDRAILLRRAEAVTGTGAPGTHLLQRFEAAEQLAAAVREQIQLLAAREVPVLADLVHALEAYDALRGGDDAAA